MKIINADLLSRLPLSEIDRVTFYKRDEIATDLICCNVAIGDEVWTFHEDLAGWGFLLAHLERLADFRSDWFESVSQPPFSASETVAFRR